MIIPSKRCSHCVVMVPLVRTNWTKCWTKKRFSEKGQTEDIMSNFSHIYFNFNTVIRLKIILKLHINWIVDPFLLTIFIVDYVSKFEEHQASHYQDQRNIAHEYIHQAPVPIITQEFSSLSIYNAQLSKDVVHENVVGGSNITWVFPLVIADSERDMPGIEPGPLGWYTSALTTGLQEVRLDFLQEWHPIANVLS